MLEETQQRIKQSLYQKSFGEQTKTRKPRGFRKATKTMIHSVYNRGKRNIISSHLAKYQQNFLNNKAPFWPPNPKLSVMATLTSRFTGLLGV